MKVARMQKHWCKEKELTEGNPCTTGKEVQCNCEQND